MLYFYVLCFVYFIRKPQETLRKKYKTERRKYDRVAGKKYDIEEEIRSRGKENDTKGKGMIGRQRVQQGGKRYDRDRNVKKLIQKSSKENLQRYKKK